jgi:transcriptional regulator with XRE-family HTH domain
MTGGELTTARLNRGFSIRALAREIDVPEQAVRRVEADERITPANAKKIADFFGVRVTDLPYFSEVTAP